LSGVLVEDPEWGLSIQPTEGDVQTSIGVVWPNGYTAVRYSDGSIALIDELDQIRATTGDYVEVGGGLKLDTAWGACGDIRIVPAPPSVAPIPTDSLGEIQYIHVSKALELAQAAVNQSSPQLRSYAPGTYESVWQVLLGPQTLTEPPDGISWDTMVWGVQFVSGDVLTTVYLDLFSGEVVDVNNRPMPSNPTAVHKSDIVFGDPAIHANNGTALDVSIYVNGAQAPMISAGNSTLIDPGAFGPWPWTIRTTTSSGRELTIGTLDPKDVWSTTGDYPLEGQSFLERIDLSCGRLDIWAGSPASGPAPGPSFPPDDCVP
jgi:hypothetical protein